MKETWLETWREESQVKQCRDQQTGSVQIDERGELVTRRGGDFSNKNGAWFGSAVTALSTTVQVQRLWRTVTKVESKKNAIETVSRFISEVG